MKEFNEGNDDYRSWIELSLQDDLKPSYPFRTEPGAMLGGSPYSNSCNESDAKFKLRVSHFLAEDIENGLDPSYDRVGNYIYFYSIDELMEQLSKYGIELKDCVDLNKVNDYPL
ncbi:hypothetical protein HC231_19565 [Brenneria izadpanahii]|uniref:Uncharacterized protein n=1 Tax=Brenneria izadpanahii TaxID=2722756 RepID=A0ABX7UYN6_9GAMM|nr:hypothetical protein HC231_19565 [Brenneria izadpanahii]